MAEAVMNLQINLCPSDETMKVILMLLNMWQDANPDQMIAMVPNREKYEYEIIRRRANDAERDERATD
jgi:hypothetical protein